MIIGLLSVEIFLPMSASLKDKRQVVQRLKTRLRGKYNVALAEVGHQELWQRARLAVVSVAARREILDRTFDEVLAESEKLVPGEILSGEREYLG